MPGLEKGTLYLAISNIIFLVTGYAVYFGLSRILPNAYEFGMYGVVVSVMSLINLALLSGMQQSVSKFVSENRANAAAVKITALRTQLSMNLIAFLAFFFLSDLLAMLFNDMLLAPLFRIAAFLLLFQPVFAICFGYVNGMEQFPKQAKIAVFYEVTKMVLILTIALLGYGVMGAVGGFVLSSIFTTVVTLAATHVPAPRISFEWRRLVAFAIPLVAFAAIFNLLGAIDLYFLKAFNPAAEIVGYYVGASTISKIPYALVTAVSFVLFPVVSRTTSKKQGVKASFYIRNALRYSLLMLGLLVAYIAAAPAELLSLFYPDSYLAAAPALAVLAFGILPFSLFIILSTAISSSAKPYVSTAIAVLAIAIAVPLNLVLVPMLSMTGAALAFSLVSLAAFLASFAYSWKRFGSLLSAGSLLKILVASAAVFFASALVYAPGLLTVLKFLAACGIYIAALYVLGELKAMDFAVLRNVFPFRRRQDTI